MITEEKGLFLMISEIGCDHFALLFQRPHPYIPESPGDKRTIELQERAEKLLERRSVVKCHLLFKYYIFMHGLFQDIHCRGSLKVYYIQFILFQNKLLFI